MTKQVSMSLYHDGVELFRCFSSTVVGHQSLFLQLMNFSLLMLAIIVQVKSVETRDSELTQMNKSYFDELQRHVDDTSEELRRTFAGKPDNDM